MVLIDKHNTKKVEKAGKALNRLKMPKKWL